MSGVLGKYRLDQRLGGGGMAEVFLASTLGAEGFTRRVAIKRVLPGFSDNPAFANMFISEAQISARLVHPNIVSVLDFDRGPDGGLYLVMELVEGHDLDALMGTGMLPLPVIIFAITEVLRGLGYAHDLPTGTDFRGIVHRDVSPHNVLLSWEGAVKVSDFGIAKARSASEATASVFIKGKPAYMSPEQANGQALDGRSDLFAVGVMMWEMVTGRRLFLGDDTRATLAAVLFGQIPRPRTLRPDLPKDLEKVVMKLLEREVPNRYVNGEAAIADLLECHDAPKNGREVLMRILAERFPQDAEVRQSGVRSRAQVQAQTPAPVHSQQPSTGLGAVPAVSMMGARTGTLPPPGATIGPPPKQGLKIAAGIIGVAVVVGGIFAVVASRGGKTEATPAGGGVASGGPTAPAPDAAVATPPDAAVAIAALPDAAPVAPPADAAVAVEPPTDAGAQKDATVVKQVQPTKKGRLVVHALPALTVYFDGKKLHDTPVEEMVPAGKHKVRLRNPDRNVDETVNVTIGDQPTVIERFK